MIQGAIISPDQAYRYLLWRIWGGGQRLCMFLMLNPSTADASIDDPTIRRCIAFAKRWGYDGLIVGNLFAYRATKPAALRTAADPVGPLNSFFLALAAASSEIIVCAWGNHGAMSNGPISPHSEMCRQLAGTGKSYALRVSSQGFPGHPLYIPNDAKLFIFPIDVPSR